MFSGRTEELIRRVRQAQIAQQRVRVILAGLDTNFRGEPFGPMPVLLALAEELTKLQAICVRSGSASSSMPSSR